MRNPSKILRLPLINVKPPQSPDLELGPTNLSLIKIIFLAIVRGRNNIKKLVAFL
jgi:hypothetical protein